uniref:PWI domain-containing protein n=1 Tax=Arion vulgaris TaxID=1028688 RepID=A0A0B7AZB7_9EUPU
MHNYAGTTAQQDTRFSDKRKKLLKTMKFADGLERKVDMTKVNVDSLKPWIAQRLTELLGIEDDVVVEFVYNQLEERRSTINKLALKHNHSLLTTDVGCSQFSQCFGS